MPGPMKVAVRFVTLRLCVPVSACSVEFVSVGLPNGNHPCVVPSSQSFWIDVSATAMVPVSEGGVGAGSLEQPTISVAKNDEAKTTSPRDLRIRVSPPIEPWSMVAPTVSSVEHGLSTLFCRDSLQNHANTLLYLSQRTRVRRLSSA